MLNNEIFTNDDIDQGSLEKTPEFYSSMSDNPSTGRFGSNLATSSKIAAIKEYIQGTTGTFFFKEIYQEPPLILGLVLYTSNTITDASGTSTFPNPKGYYVRMIKKTADNVSKVVFTEGNLIKAYVIDLSYLVGRA